MAVRNRLLLALVASLVFPAAASAGLQKAKDDLAVTAPGHSVWINVLANDADLGADLRLLKAFKPAHGSVAIENGGLRYTPNAGFQGSDSFRYMAQPAKSQPGEATVDVEVGSGGVALTLVGRVVDDPLPGAVVTAAVGGFEFRTSADAQGIYRLDIAALRGDAFVTLVATGRSPSGVSADFYSLVGEMARLSAAAGSDGILVRDENNQVQVTNLSTAQYWLLAEDNGGQPVGNDQALLTLVQNIDLERLVELAAVIQLVYQHQADMPAGTTSFLDLISDDAAVAAVEAQVGATALQTAKDAVADDPALTSDYKAGALPGGYAVIPASQPGTISPFSGVARLITFTGSASGNAGSGTDYDLFFQSAPQMSWALVDGELLVTPTTPWEFGNGDQQNSHAGCQPGNFESLSEHEIDSRYHRLQDGAGVDYVQVTTRYHRTFIDDDPNDGCPTSPDEEYSVTVRRLAFEDGAGELPFASGEAFGTFGISTWNPLGQYWGASLFNFGPAGGGSGTVGFPGLLPGFDWAVNNGRLQLHTHLAAGGSIDYEYRRYQLDGHKGEGLFALATLPDGRKAASYNLSVRFEPGSGFVATNMPGSWRSGAVLAEYPDALAADGYTDFYLDLNGDGPQTGRQRLYLTDGSINTYVGFHWDVVGDAFVAKSYFEPTAPPGMRQIAACISPYPTPCWQIRQRDWLPVARDGYRYYVLETLSLDTEHTLQLTVSEGGQRINFWEDQTPP